MAEVSRLRLQWSGTAVVGASVSTFYTLAAPSSLMTAASTMLTAMRGNWPVSLTAQFQGSGELIDTSTGQATGSWASAAPAAVVGQDVGVYAHGVGYRIVWNTGTFSNGRRVKGSTYIVPVGAGGFNTAGEPNATVVNAWQTAVNTFVTAMAGNLVIVTRPTTAHPVGGHASVASGLVSSKVSWLKSRRT